MMDTYLFQQLLQLFFERDQFPCHLLYFSEYCSVEVDLDVL